MDQHGTVRPKGMHSPRLEISGLSLLTCNQNEKLVAPADNHNTTGQFDPTQHGYNGSILTSLTGNNGIPLDEHVIATTQQLPDEFPFRLDMTGGSQGVIGIGADKKFVDAPSSR